ncbi:MAG: dynamin family protein [Burkholderiales bacterium]|nr:dynamin family protein [Burkholderiales bacterium]
MSTHFEDRIAGFAKWRADMIAGIEFYKSWLDANGIADIQQSLRIYDLVESLKHERLTLAFIAEFSRGKTELINALLFGQFKRRILPSDVGRTTMSPTEIFHDPSEPPYLRLLPIETRQRSETVASLKRKPVEWIKMRLDTSSEEALAQALQALIETKTVSKQQAMALGLYDHPAPEATTVLLTDPDQVRIPAWRHALINYPHPLLTSGLVVLDTPGLNALGTEPELTMSMIPNAHAVLFLLAMDAGVTRSDLDVWRRHVQPRVARRLAVLNKIDLLWDDIKTDAEIAQSIERQLVATAQLLALPSHAVLPLSAKKALVARVRGDAELLRRSGIETLEALLADEIVPAKQEIMREAIEREIGTMVESSRQSIVIQFNALRAEHKSLTELAGKNRGVAQAMLQRLENDRAGYLQSVQRHRSSVDEVSQRGKALLASLSDEALESLMNKDRKYIEDAWSTAGLIKNMQGLFEHFSIQSNRILKFSREILALVEQAYAHFHDKAGFQKLSPPQLNLEKHTLAITHLRQSTIEYCHHPKQILTEKHFLVPNFYESLVAEARRVFEETRDDTRKWLRAALAPLDAAIKEHEIQLSKRVENLGKLQHNLHAVGARLKQLEQQSLALKAQHEVLVGIKKNLGALPADKTAAEAAQASPANEPHIGVSAHAA